METFTTSLLQVANDQSLLEATQSKEGFAKLIKKVQETKGYKNPIGFAISRNDIVKVKNESGSYQSKVAQCNMPVVNFNKENGENLGSAAVLHLALALNGYELNTDKSEAVYELNLDIISTALQIFGYYLPEAEEDDSSHQNIQILLDIEDIMENPGDLMPQEIHGTKRDQYSVVFIYEDAPLESVEATYLKFNALSHEKAELRSLNLNGAFGATTNVAWCEVNNTIVPVSLDWLNDNKRILQMTGNYPIVRGNDKFPQYLDHVVPKQNTRVLDTSKVRFGAQLAAGTTVMPGASYINFNAGTTGPVMVEGRISSSAIVGNGSDIGGGASILGVLSGTDGNPISVGQNCLLGANSVCGIPLGDACIIDAGLAILEGTKVKISPKELEKINAANDANNQLSGKLFKAKDLSGLNGSHYRQNSMTGEITVSRSTREVKLNAELH